MSTAIELRVDRVRDAARLRARAIAAVRALSVVLAVWLTLGALDALVRPVDPGLRWMLGLTAWGVALGGGVWARRRSRSVDSLDSIYVAQRIERFFPQLRDRLAVAYEFAVRPANATGGSPELRQAALRETAALAENLDFHETLADTSWRRHLLSLAVVVGIWLAMFAAAPTTAGIGVQRLLAPWRELAWPRRHQLDWLEFPHRAAVGGEVSLQLRDLNGRLPDSVQLWFRYEDGATEQVERAEMRRVDDRFVYRFEQLSRSVFVRAEGGDDSTMPWQLIEVDEPPRVERLDVTLVPPEYAGRPPERAGQPLRALAGTRVDVAGRASRPLARAAIRGGDDSIARGADVIVAVGVIGEDGQSFAFPTDPMMAWTVQRSGVFWLELTDRSGLAGEGGRFVVQLLPDDPPSIAWESPEPDDVVTVTGEAPIVATVKDDLAVRRVALRYRVTKADGTREATAADGADFEEIDLFVGPDRPPAATEMMGDAPGETRRVNERWKLGERGGIRAGSHLDLWLVAEDYKGQLVEAAARRLQVISTAEYEERLGQREATLLHILGEALRGERETQQQIAAVGATLRETGRLESRHLDQLQAAELQQRQVVRLLSEERDGARGLIAAISLELRHNQVTNESLVARMAAVREALMRIDREHLTHISPELLAVRKSAPVGDGQAKWPNADDAAVRLDDAQRHAEAVCRALDELLAQLAPWDDLRRTLREFARLVRDQEDVRRRTAELLQGLDETNERRAAERTRLAEREYELERRFERLVARLARFQADVTSGGAERARNNLAEAVAAAKQATVGEQLRDAAQQLAENRLGQALAREDEALTQLQRLVERFNGRSGERDRPSSVPRAEQEILRILSRQREILAAIEALEARRKKAAGAIDAEAIRQAAAWGADEGTLARETSELAEQVQGDDEGIAFALRGAARQTERVARQLADVRQDLPAAVESLAAVVRRLELLVESLRADAPGENPPDGGAQPKPEESEPRQGAARVRGLAELKLLQSLQRELSRRTGELETARRRQGSLTPELAGELRELASEQGRLAELVGKLLEAPREEDR